MSAKKHPQIPQQDADGFHPTLNQYGWSSENLGWLLEEFIRCSSTSPLWSLDVGCAYGFHTAAAIKSGARVVANDLSAEHLRIASAQIPTALKLNLRTRKGSFTKVTLPEGAFGVIMASNVMHFMDPPTIEAACRKMFKLLAPGGKALVSAQTPYVKTLTKFIPEYERLKAAGEKWPGYIPDPGVWVEKRSPHNHGHAHLLEPSILSRGFAEAGFVVDKAEFTPTLKADRQLDGRERTLLVARRP